MQAQETGTSIHLPIAEVTLLEDRAHVVRRGTVHLPGGRSCVRIDGVSPLIVDKTLAADAAGARVVDARIRRRKVRPAVNVADIEAELRAVVAEQSRIEGERDLARNQLARLERAATQAVDELTEDVAWARSEVAAWTERLEGTLQAATRHALAAADAEQQVALLGERRARTSRRRRLHPLGRAAARLRARRRVPAVGAAQARRRAGGVGPCVTPPGGWPAPWR